MIDLGVTFIKNHFSINSEGEIVEVCEFEFDRFTKYRLTFIDRAPYLLEKEDSENNIWEEIKRGLDIINFSYIFKSILPRNPGFNNNFVTPYEFEIARTFWLKGREHKQEEIEREKVQKKEEKKKARKDRMF